MVSFANTEKNQILERDLFDIDTDYAKNNFQTSGMLHGNTTNPGLNLPTPNWLSRCF